MRVYELFLNDELKDGVNAISVVGEPAMESQFIALKKEERKQAFAKVDDKKKILMGIIMKPNKKIYRYDEESKEEYEVFFSEQTVRRASELYFKNNKQRNFNVEHNSDDTLEGYLVESWIVEDADKDKSAVYNLGAEVGDWVGSLKFESDAEYQKALENGTGFSLEGVFSEKVILNRVNDMSINFEKEKVEEGVLSALKKFFSKSVKMGMAKLMDGGATLEFEGEMPQAGASINLVTPDGEVPAPVGEHELEDGKVIVITEAGIIAEVKDKEAEVEVEVEQIKEGAPTTAMDTTGELKDMISSILVKFGEDLKADLTNHIETKFAESKKAVDDLKVELSSQPAVERTKDAPIEKENRIDFSKMSKQERILHKINNLKK